MEKISINFLNELFLSCLSKREITEIVVEHLKYQYIPDEFKQYKQILKSIVNTFKTNDQLSSIGTISQQYPVDVKVQSALTSIKEANLPSKDITLSTLESYIKKSKFVELNKKLEGLYNKGEHDEAIKLQAKESEEIVNFSIKKVQSYFSPIYKGFNKRQDERKASTESGEHKREKVLFGIDPIDRLTYGGIDLSDTVLWIMRSGVGKSTVLKWHAISAVRKHKNVLHIQLEGSKKEAEEKYDQAWTACLYNDIRRGNINDTQHQVLQTVINHMNSHNSDIYVHAFEQFNTASMIDVRNLIIDFEKIYGHIDEIIIDYLKHLHPGDGNKYDASIQGVKMKKENTSEKIKNTAVEFGTRIITADQASDVGMDIWNDPNKVLTRHNISGAKNLPDSYSYVFTGNQTNEERKQNLMRIHADKFRNYPLPTTPIKIATAYTTGRFYDHTRTKAKYFNKGVGRYEY